MKKGFVAALLAAGFLVSCGEQPSQSEAPNSPEPLNAAKSTVSPSTSQAETRPAPAATAPAEAKPMLVGIESGKPRMVFLYTYSNYSYTDTYGFNTYAYKFYSDEAGHLVGCVVYELRKEGERERERFAFTRQGGGDIAVESSQRGEKSFSITVKGDSLEAESSDASLSISRTAGRGLRLERRYGARTMTEDWPGSLEAESRIQENGSLVAKGEFAAKGTDRVVYTEIPLEGADAIEYEVGFSKDFEAVVFKTDSLAPLSVCRVVGAEEILSGPRFLENALLLEVIVGERGRISPYLAYMTLH